MPIKELTIAQASAATGYNASTIQRAARLGQIKARRAGKRWLVETASLMEFGQRRPHKRATGAKAGEPMQLDLSEEQVQEAKEILEESSPALIITEEPAQEPDWMNKTVFTYSDLLTQYQRGFIQGFKEGREATAEKVEAALHD